MTKPIQTLREKMNNGAICGGVVPLSKALKDTEGAYLMSFVMPDKQYKKYIIYRQQGKDKEAKQIFDKYARSQI